MPNSGFNAVTRNSDEWQTPRWLFDALDSEFGFNLDAAATAENALCKHYFSLDGENALETEWQQGTRVVRAFCNPPYSQCDEFVNAAMRSNVELAVLLLPVRTDSNWHRRLTEASDALCSRVELRYFRKRVDFLEDGKQMGSPRFASLVAIIKRR